VIKRKMMKHGGCYKSWPCSYFTVIDPWASHHKNVANRNFAKCRQWTAGHGFGGCGCP